jgi:thioredoxin reductase (NADPH)
MTVPARTPAQRAIAGAFLASTEWRSELSRRPGLHTQPNHGLYDVVVAGAGPAGLTAAVYASSEGLRTVVLERLGAGRSSGKSARTENYLGFPEGFRYRTPRTRRRSSTTA